MRLDISRVFLLFSLLAADVGCKKSEPAPATLPATVEAAPAPPAERLELVSTFEAPLLDGLLRAYLEAQPGVELKITRRDEAALVGQLVRGELRGDVVLGLSREDMDGLVRAGRLAVTRPATCADLPAAVRDTAGYWVGLVYSAVALGIHEPQLREKQLAIPRTWQDLTGKQFHGWTVMARPRVSRASRLLIGGLAATLHPRGWDLWKRIDQNLFQYTPGEEDPARMVGSGEAVLAIDFEKRLLAQRKAGKPVHIAYPTPTFFDVETLALLAGSQNTAAGQKFASWMCTEAALRVLDAFRAGVTKPFFESPTPGKLRVSQLKLATPDKPFTREAFFEEWQQRYGK